MAVAQHIARDLPRSTEISRQFTNSLFTRFYPALRSFLLKNLRNPADAEDIAQEVYVRFLGVDNPRKIRSERAFLFTVARNLLRDRSRRLATRLIESSTSIDDLDLQSSSDDPARRYQAAELLEAVLHSIDELSANSRRAFWLSRVEGLSYSEIADEMGVSVSMVEKHISAALVRVKEVIDSTEVYQ